MAQIIRLLGHVIRFLFSRSIIYDVRPYGHLLTIIYLAHTSMNCLRVLCLCIPNNTSRPARQDLEKFRARPDRSIIDLDMISDKNIRFLYDIFMHVCQRTRWYNYGESQVILSHRAPKHALHFPSALQIFHTYREKTLYSEIPTPLDLSNDTSFIVLALILSSLKVGTKSSSVGYNTRSSTSARGATVGEGR